MAAFPRYTEDFPARLQGLTLEVLEAERGAVYALSDDFRLIYFNQAWCDFAVENGAPELASDAILGRNLAEVIGEELWRFYSLGYQRVLADSKPWELSYDCSGPDQPRRFHQQNLPLRNGSGILVVNRLERSQTLVAPSGPDGEIDPEAFRQQDGFIHQCSNCKDVMSNDGSELWVRVVPWLSHFPPRVSHTICPLCLQLYWKTDG